jgi:hypothetical protein
MSKRLEEHTLRIENGDPPERSKTSYQTKTYSGALRDIAQRIKPGQYVQNLSVGSLGKLRKYIEERGLHVISRHGQAQRRGTLYVVSKEWLMSHPDEHDKGRPQNR